MTGLETLCGRTATAEDVIAVLERDGGVIIENFMSDEMLGGLREDLVPLLEKQPAGRDEQAGMYTRRLSRLFARTSHIADMATHPLYLPIAEHFVCRAQEAWFGDHRLEIVPDLRIGVTQAIALGPNETAQGLHRDDVVFMWRHPTNGREGRVQIIGALTDFTLENGATHVIPGSHLWDDIRKPEQSEVIRAVMKAGSALIFLGSTYHGGGANTTEEYRYAVSMALDAANVRQEENMYLSMTNAEVARYPEQIQRLLGWSSGGNAMGWIEIEGQLADPNILLGNVKEGTVKAKGLIASLEKTS